MSDWLSFARWRAENAEIVDGSHIADDCARALDCVVAADELVKYLHKIDVDVLIDSSLRSPEAKRIGKLLTAYIKARYAR